MGLLSSTKLETLEDLFVHQLEDLYDAEQRLVDALPKMADAAASSELRSAFKHHLAETEQHVMRLERVFQGFGKDANRVACDGIKGILKEGEAVIDAKGEAAVKDAALIAAAQRVEHYEMAGYGSARSFAEWLGRNDLAELLQQTLDEEGAADQKLTAIAQGSCNPAAART